MQDFAHLMIPRMLAVVLMSVLCAPAIFASTIQILDTGDTTTVTGTGFGSVSSSLFVDGSGNEFLSFTASTYCLSDLFNPCSTTLGSGSGRAYLIEGGDNFCLFGQCFFAAQVSDQLDLN